MREIAVVLFNDFETLDVFGPVEVFGRLKDQFNIRFYSWQGGAVTSSHQVTVVTERLPMRIVSPYILLIPGGIGTRGLIKDSEFTGRLRSLSEGAEYTLTVCTGSVLFSKTGLLDGRRATSNKRVFFWGGMESPGVDWVKSARWIKDGNIYTSSGVSAGIDMALGFVSDLLGYDTAKQQSLEIEYFWSEDPDNDPFAEMY